MMRGRLRLRCSVRSGGRDGAAGGAAGCGAVGGPGAVHRAADVRRHLVGPDGADGALAGAE